MLSIVLCETIFKFSYMFFFKSLPLPLLTVRHIYEISEMTTHERRTIVTRPRSLMDFSLRCVRFYPGVNSRAELVTLAPGLRLEARGLVTICYHINMTLVNYSRFQLTLFSLKCSELRYELRKFVAKFKSS